MASTTTLPPKSSHGTVPALPNGTATMMTSASATSSAGASTRAPGATTETSRSSAVCRGEPVMRTSYPDATRSRASAVPTFPAPKMPMTGRSVTSTPPFSPTRGSMRRHSPATPDRGRAFPRAVRGNSLGLTGVPVGMRTHGDAEMGQDMAERYEFGLDTFGDVTVAADGSTLTHAQVLRNVVDEAVLADRLGLDFFGVGEHHRHEFAVSAPEVVLGTIAGRTERIHLGSAVTVLSSDDPVRVFQRFATLDGLSGGRAEVILGRGSFIESFPLFGFELNQYQELFEEKLNLFAELIKQEPVTWSGELRAPLTDQL